MLECVVNISEGRRREVVDDLASAAGGCLLDVHVDPHHNRAVLTMAGADLEAAVRAVARRAVAAIDLRDHAGVHPRMGAVDVVPFIPLGGTPFDEAVAARDRFAAWAAADLGLPAFLYGPGIPLRGPLGPGIPLRGPLGPGIPLRGPLGPGIPLRGPLGPGIPLPEVRRRAFVDLAPDTGPPSPHPSAGAVCVGARPALVAYNVWLEPGVDVAAARAVAAAVRGPAVRALGLDVGGRAQVSMNLVDPEVVGPARAYDAVAAQAPVAHAELVGLAPAAVVTAVDPARWAELDLDPTRTIESRMAERAGG